MQGRRCAAATRARRSARASRTCPRIDCGPVSRPRSRSRRTSYSSPIAATGRVRAAAPARAIREHRGALIERYDVRGGGPELPARQLSGGNLQKVVLAREFEGEPRVLVVASPTRGLDVAAIETVHAYLREAAAEGVGVLLISEDLDEILALVRPGRGHVRGRRSSARCADRRRDGRGARPADGGRCGRMIRIERRLIGRGGSWPLCRSDRSSSRSAVMTIVLLATHHAPGHTFQRLFDAGVRRPAVAERDLHLGDAAALHRALRGDRLPHAALQHRRRGPALRGCDPRRGRGNRDRQPLGLALDPGDDRRGRCRRRGTRARSRRSCVRSSRRTRSSRR